MECLSKPKLIISTEHGVAIWDLTIFSSGSSSYEVWLAEDSGKVTQLSFDATLQLTK